MPIYIALGRITEQGIKNLGGLTERHQQAVKRAESLGGKVVASYALMGHYDFIAILDCPDNTTALKILTKEASGGNIAYETHPAVSMEEFAKLMKE